MEVKFIISGRVQGVGFRFSTQDKAVELNLTGYAQNLPNGTVELLVCGEREKIASFSSWLQSGGPLSSSISNITAEEVTLKKPPTSFSVL